MSHEPSDADADVSHRRASLRKPPILIELERIVAIERQRLSRLGRFRGHGVKRGNDR